MSTAHGRWLLQQLPHWEQEGLLTSDAARILRERHAADPSQPGIGQIVMGALGALLIGTGIIAVIGYNWDDFSRPVRLLFAFLPLLFTQLFSLFVLRQGSNAAAWVRETAALLQTLAAGAALALVSQIYNLGGEWPDFLFWWFLVSLPLVWVLHSHSVAIFYLIAIAIWSANQVEPGHSWHESPLLYPILLLGMLPYWPGWRSQRPLSPAVRWVMALSAIAGLASVAIYSVITVFDRWGHFESVLWLWTLTAAVVTLLPLSGAGIAESTGRKPQVVLGSLWLLGFGIAATFSAVSDDIVEGIADALKLPWCWVLLALVGVFIVLAVSRRRWAVLALASVAILPLILFPFVSSIGSFPGTVLSSLVTLHLAAVGLTLILLDFAGKPAAPRLGATLLSIVIIARMADSHFSFLAKGLAFIVVGVAFLAFNFFMSRRHRQQRALATA